MSDFNAEVYIPPRLRHYISAESAITRRSEQLDEKSDGTGEVIL